MKLTIAVWRRVNDFVKETSLQQMTALQRWRMCDRKKPYATRSKANKAARKRDMYIYQCPVCSAFHITKIPKMEQKPLKATIRNTDGQKKRSQSVQEKGG